MSSIMSFPDAENQLAQRQKTKQDEEDVLKCPKCKGTWFGQEIFRQYADNHSVVLGQAVPQKGVAEFILLRCAKCNELLEPRLLRNARDNINTKYDEFVDSLKGTPVKTDKV